jgi:hypothetical protein
MHLNHIHSAFLTLYIFLLMPAVRIAGQTLPAEEVQVIKNFEARLGDANKMRWNPTLPGEDTVELDYMYDVLVKILDVDYPAPNIRPISVRSERIPSAYRGFLQLGYGYPQSPYGNFSYHHNNVENTQIGVTLKHHSADHPDVANQKFSDSQGSLGFSYLFENGLILRGRGSYSQDDYYFYGIPVELVDTTTELKHRFKELTAGVSLGSTNANSNFDYGIDIDFYRLTDNFDVEENGISLKINTSYWLGDAHPLSLEMGTDFSNMTDTVKRELHNFYIQPSFTYNGSTLSLTGGVKMFAHMDEYTFYPLARLEAKLLQSEVILFAGAGGEFYKNNFRSISKRNPFTSPRIDSIGNTQYAEYYGGLKGTIGVLNYEAKVSYKSIDALGLFVNDPVNPGKFKLIYDDGTLISAKATVVTRATDNLEVLVSAEKLFFDLDNEEKAWHQPDLRGNLGLHYHTSDGRLKIKGEFFYIAPFPIRQTADNEIEKSNNLFDVSLGIDFFFTEHFGVFAHLNNLAATKWNRWYQYPTYDINGVGGIVARF